MRVREGSDELAGSGLKRQDATEFLLRPAAPAATAALGDAVPTRIAEVSIIGGSPCWEWLTGLLRCSARCAAREHETVVRSEAGRIGDRR